jgi:uncharacterized protein YjbI with pentapeptide repeats
MGGEAFMPELTADIVLKRIKSGDKLERADLRGLAMPRAILEGVSFHRSDLDGANFEGARLSRAQFKNASLREAFLVAAELRDANLEGADLEGVNLKGANLAGANLNRANLEGAQLQGANLTGARLKHAQLTSANLAGASLVRARLAHAVLTEADLSTAKLDDADLSNADMTSASLEEASLVRATLRGAQMRDANLKDADLTDAGGLRPALQPLPPEAANKRYFGRGDVLRNAELEFHAGASVEIESLLEQCTIALGEATDLVIGKAGVLRRCQLSGAGKITIHGQFVERESPGIVGATHLLVSSAGSLVGSVVQPAELTNFSFEPGCMLRMKIHTKIPKKERPAARRAGRGRQR